MMTFPLLSALLALFCIILSILFFRLSAGASKELTNAIPRCKIPGIILGIVCLIWSAWHGCLMLEGTLEKFHPVVWILVPVTAILSYIYLDYLFSRSLGGFFVLMANELIRQAFGNDVALRPLYSIICLLIGVMGLFLIGTPWRLRDAFELASSRQTAGRIISIGFMLCACILILLPLL